MSPAVESGSCPTCFTDTGDHTDRCNELASDRQWDGLAEEAALFAPDGFNARAGIAERVKASREMHGWTRTELAERSSLSKSAISRLEAAKSDVLAIHLYRIAQALGVSISSLMGDPEQFAAGTPEPASAAQLAKVRELINRARYDHSMVCGEAPAEKGSAQSYRDWGIQYGLGIAVQAFDHPPVAAETGDPS